MTEVRRAHVHSNRPSVVARYLPSNYEIVGLIFPDIADQVLPDIVVIQGTDVAGWTLDDYVIPRLASGLIRAEEVHSNDD